jgi:hypothetical protein
MSLHSLDLGKGKGWSLQPQDNQAEGSRHNLDTGAPEAIFPIGLVVLLAGQGPLPTFLAIYTTAHSACDGDEVFDE